MLGPGWGAGCPGCSLLSDHIDGALPHLEHHDVTWTTVSRAPLDEIAAYKKRMGWHFPWVSSFGSDFNHDFHVSFTKEELVADIQAFLYRYVDLSPLFAKIASYYVLLTWVHDAFNEVPYLRLRGE